MDVADVMELLVAAEPQVKEVVVDLIKAFSAKDADSVRKATEAALRLAFEARQDARSE